jgi:microsomal epoxide hydrolase
MNAARRALLAAPFLFIRNANAAAQSKFFRSSDGVRLHYAQNGIGRVLVFVPGWCMPARIFAPQIAYFQQRFTVIAFDPRGQGQSAIPAQGYEPERRGRDIADLLTQLPPDRVVLIGWSLGVLDALSWLAMQGDARLAGLVLIDNSVGEADPPPPRASNFFANLRKERDKTVRGFVNAMYRTPQDAAYLDGIAREAQRMPVEASIKLLSYPRPREFWRQSLYATRRPVFYAVTPRLRAQAEAVAARHAAPMTSIYEDAGHALFVDRADRFNDELLQFITKKALWS